MRCGVIFDNYFAANLLENLSEKKILKIGSEINGVTAMNLASPFFGTQCTMFK